MPARDRILRGPGEDGVAKEPKRNAGERRRVKTPEQLETYRSKRDFSRTPEPPPAPVPSNAADDDHEWRPFVIHRHEARNLHYDLRLEMEGVLKSWAVPRGFSWDPADKHLAVQTEDHPREYLGFDGVIPKGEYGAGTMVIHDEGSYREVGAGGLAGLAAGKLEVEFDGARLRGQWHMVRTRGERDWLLFKYRDRYAREAGDPPFPLDLRSRPRRAAGPPGTLMRPAASAPPVASPDWVYELDFEGQRVQVRVDGDDVGIFDAAGAPLGSSLPEVERDLRRIRAMQAWIDGVLVAPGDDGRPDAARLVRQLGGESARGIVLYAFDLLHYDAWDLRDLPLRDRKAALASLLPRSTSVHYVDHVASRGADLLAVVAAGGLRGILAKREDSPYASGESAAWGRIEAPASSGGGEGTLLERLEAASSRRRSRVKFTNRDKVYWPRDGITKGRLLDSYDAVADTLVPYLRGRPCHMLRYPDGIEGKSFYQKNVTGRIPDWVPTQLVKVEGGEEVRYVVCEDRDTLMFLVNLGSIDLHPWLSRCDAPDVPDLAVIDLDPTTSDFGKVVRIAQTVGRILRGAGLRPCVKTSGATGMHIHLPLVREYSYEQTRMFCELVARLAVREHKDIATVERTPAKRGDKVYVDFLQNRREQTLVPPYVVRPVPGATVSTPLDWDEVRSGLSPSQFDLSGVPDRLQSRGDLFRGILDDPQSLDGAIAALADR